MIFSDAAKPNFVRFYMSNISNFTNMPSTTSDVSVLGTLRSKLFKFDQDSAKPTIDSIHQCDVFTMSECLGHINECVATKYNKDAFFEKVITYVNKSYFQCKNDNLEVTPSSSSDTTYMSAQSTIDCPNTIKFMDIINPKRRNNK